MTRDTRASRRRPREKGRLHGRYNARAPKPLGNQGFGSLEDNFEQILRKLLRTIGPSQTMENFATNKQMLICTWSGLSSLPLKWQFRVWTGFAEPLCVCLCACVRVAVCLPLSATFSFHTHTHTHTHNRHTHTDTHTQIHTHRCTHSKHTLQPCLSAALSLKGNCFAPAVRQVSW